MSLGDARWIRRAVHPAGLPVQLTFFVTSRCNAKCAHCFYGEQLNQPAERELKLEAIERVARGLPRMLGWRSAAANRFCAATWPRWRACSAAGIAPAFSRSSP